MERRSLTMSNIVINLMLCGDWAESSFEGNECPAGPCVDLVNDEPGALIDTRFDLGSVR